VVGKVAIYSTTASKRLRLAAEGSGVAPFLFQREANAEGIAAVTRWRIAAPKEALGIPSVRLGSGIIPAQPTGGIRIKLRDSFGRDALSQPLQKPLRGPIDRPLGHQRTERSH